MNRSDFLFAKPSFIGGMSSVLDLGATLVEYNDSPNVEMADAIAMHSDWAVTGQDIAVAAEQWRKRQNGKAE